MWLCDMHALPDITVWLGTVEPSSKEGSVYLHILVVLVT